MHVNVIYSKRLQLNRVIRTQEGVQKSFGAASRRFLPFQQYPRQQAGNTLPAPQKQSKSSEEYWQSDRLQTENLDRSVSPLSLMRFCGTPRTACNHSNSPLSQFLNFLPHIGLYRRGKLIGEIGHG